jgi:hypothetical protein
LRYAYRQKKGIINIIFMKLANSYREQTRKHTEGVAEATLCTYTLLFLLNSLVGYLFWLPL